MFIEKIKSNKQWKLLIHRLLMNEVKARPRLWLRLLQVFYMKKGKGSVIYRSVRRDIVPFREFSLGKRSIIEDYAVVNNAVGDVFIGDNSRIGIGNTVIGPITIGNNVCIGQHVTFSGLNHNYDEIGRPISEQGVNVAPIMINNNVWIGANSVVLAGVNIGEHSIIGAGSVVNRDIPPYSLAVGNPARVVKRFDFEKNEWVKL